MYTHSPSTELVAGERRQGACAGACRLRTLLAGSAAGVLVGSKQQVQPVLSGSRLMLGIRRRMTDMCTVAQFWIEGYGNWLGQ